jgi:cobyrinic acid a,c-diamide synthase
MGLFDGAPPDGRGATADLAEILHLPVVLVLDCAAMGHSVAALVGGFRGHRPGVEIAGVILNRTGSDRHEALLRRALGEVAVLGVWRRDAALALPSRHLGLTLPDGGAEAFLAAAGARAAAGLDLAALAALARPLPPAGPQGPALPPPGKVIALARDAAFAFAYDHVIAGWRRAGSAVREFSPLAGEAPAAEADAVILPGGYPELFAADLAAAKGFRQGMEAARDRGALIDGECGGYMVLGRGLTDADGRRHEMLGFLRLETSFAARKLHLGYRTLIAKDGRFCGHEFHYATTLKAEGEPLFQARNAEGEDLAPMGLRQGNVRGSFAHRIAVAGGK